MNNPQNVRPPLNGLKLPKQGKLRYAASTNSFQHSHEQRRSRLMYLLLGLLTAVAIIALAFTTTSGIKIAAIHTPQMAAVIEIKAELTAAHLWFEEVVSGDVDEDIAKVWEHLDTAESYTQVMLEGGEFDGASIAPIGSQAWTDEVQHVVRGLEEFRELAELRLLAQGTSGIGSELDRRFDAAFAELLVDVDHITLQLQQEIKAELTRFRLTSVLIAIGLVALALVA